MKKYIKNLVSKLYNNIAHLYFFIISRLKSETSNLHALNFASCEFRLWRTIYGDKLVDLNSPAFQEIEAVTRAYVFKDCMSDLDWEILFDARHAFVPQTAKTSKNYKFVIQHRCPHILKQHLQISRAISMLAGQSVKPFQRSLDRNSEQYWRKLLRQNFLPNNMNISSLRSIKSWLKRQIRSDKKAIRFENLQRIHFSVVALSATAALSAPWLVILGMLRSYILATSFDIPFGYIYTLGDYLSQGINQTPSFALGLGVAVVFFGYQIQADVNHTNIVTSELSPSNPNRWFIHFVGASTVAVGFFLWWMTGEISPTHFFIGTTWIASIVMSELIGRFFDNRIAAFFALWAIIISAITTSTDAFRDIHQIKHGIGPKAELSVATADGLEASRTLSLVSIAENFAVLFDKNKQLIYIIKSSELTRILPKVQQKNSLDQNGHTTSVGTSPSPDTE